MAKEPKDILDENVIERLNAANPTNRDIAEGLKLVIRMLWSEERLREVVREEHRQLCEECEFRIRSGAAHEGAAGQDGCALVAQDGEDAGPVTRRTVLRSLKEIALETIRAPWFWIPVATVCGILCARYNISLPAVGGGN